MPTDLQQIFAAIAFAEENEHETALNLLYYEQKGKSMFKRIGKVLGKFRKTVDNYQEQITFAEAGSFEFIEEQQEVNEIQPSKLLVVGNQANFSDKIIEYAIEMAKRLSYDIIALNTAPFSCNTMSLFSTHQKKLCNDFSELARTNVSKFEEKAKENGLSFKHIIMFNTLDEAQKEVFKEHKNISFIISNEIEDRVTSEDRKQLENRVFVYSMI